ncbi:hypothetical protein ABCR94_13440 [Streptomyces sp. 21So2-11]
MVRFACGHVLAAPENAEPLTEPAAAQGLTVASYRRPGLSPARLV